MAEIVNYERIKGTVASLLFLFAAIENEGRTILAKSNQLDRLAKARGARAVLIDWKDLVEGQRSVRPEEAALAARLYAQMQGPLEVRNGVCHGLIGASSERDGEPATLTWRVEGAVKSMTYNELQAMFAWLSKIPLAMGMISHAVLQEDRSKLRPFPNRDFWESEFGIDFDSSI